MTTPTPIDIPFLPTDNLELRLTVGACRLRSDALVKINAAVSSVEISVPATTAVKMSGEAVMGGIDTGDGFMKREGAWWNEAALSGQTPASPSTRA